MGYSLDWYILTFSMILCFLVAFSCILLQYKSSEYFWDKLKLNPFLDSSAVQQIRQSTIKQSILLHGIYATSVLCTLQCFLCHISHEFPHWFCQYGMAICVVIYAAAKTFLYGYLLERATKVQTNQSIIPIFILKKVFPIYLVIYFAIYCICCPLYFRGELADPFDIKAGTACKFGRYWPPLFITSAILDVLNCILLTVLFIAPNCKDIYQSKSQIFNSPQQIKIFLTQTNIHILCTFICSASSFIFMLIMANANDIIPELIWLGGNIDMMINCVMSFTTVPQNRDYCQKFLCCSYLNCSRIMECNLCCWKLERYLLENIKMNAIQNDDIIEEVVNDDDMDKPILTDNYSQPLVNDDDNTDNIENNIDNFSKSIDDQQQPQQLQINYSMNHSNNNHNIAIGPFVETTMSHYRHFKPEKEIETERETKDFTKGAMFHLLEMT